jgi:hypothetical protein
MTDFIYDKGACVARIVNGEVFSETTKRLVATIREGKVYAPNGEFLGNLQGASIVRTGGDSTPEAFSKTLTEG